MVGCQGQAKDGPGETLASARTDKPPERKWLLNYYDSMGPGIELHKFVEQPGTHRIGPVMALFDDAPLGLSDEWRDRLRADGLRLVAVPMEEVEGLLKALVRSPVEERIWMGTVPMWQPIALGTPVDGSQMVRAGGTIGSYANGRFRFLMRAYPSRLSDSDAPIRLETTIQFYQPTEDPFRLSQRRASQEGPMVPTSSLQIDLDGTYAVFLTAEDPLLEWKPLTPKEESEARPPEETQEETDPEPPVIDGTGTPIGGEKADANKDKPAPGPPGSNMGPHGPEVRTVGEETLVSADGMTRAVLVFVPRLPSRGSGADR
jgi:hypothetical protein